MGGETGSLRDFQRTGWQLIGSCCRSCLHLVTHRDTGVTEVTSATPRMKVPGAYHYRVLRIDPHAHSTASDGTDSPTALIEAAAAADLDVVGIVDHDTFDGWVEAETAASRIGIGLVRGAEVTAEWQNRPVHLLALLPDPTDRELNDLFTSVRTSRYDRLRRMTENLQNDFPLVRWQAILDRSAGSTMGRPHLADEIVAQGYFPDRSAVFDAILGPDGPYWEPQHSLSPVEVVKLVRGAGGVPVLAHPRAAKRGRPLPEEVIEELAQVGLFGMERDHRDHSPEDRREVDRLAERFSLRVTGGSDYHGSGKPNRLGENMLSPNILAEIREQATTEVLLP